MSTNIVTAEGFPHGVRCERCGRVLAEGEEYANTLEGFTEDIPVCGIVCLMCESGGCREVDE